MHLKLFDLKFSLACLESTSAFWTISAKSPSFFKLPMVHQIMFFIDLKRFLNCVFLPFLLCCLNIISTCISYTNKTMDGTADIMTRVVYCMVADVGETGVPREKPPW